MKVVILAGGMGTRLSEETDYRPKPMVEIGGWPIIWHIMQIYSHYGFSDFVIPLGYKGDHIKRFFLDYKLGTSNVSIRLDRSEVNWHATPVEKWRIDLIETGDSTNTGGRIKRLKKYLGNETFLLTYGDGVADVNISSLVEFHKLHGKLATVTAVRPPARFGLLDIQNNQVNRFMEKPQVDQGWINGGFFVLEPSVLDYIDGDMTSFEQSPLERLADAGELMAYQHTDFWQPMDTLRDVKELRSLWDGGNAPWKVWT